MSRQSGAILLTLNQWPWCVLQVITTTEAGFADTLARCKARGGFVATHDTNRTFCVIHLGSGNTDGKHPERDFPTNTPSTANRYLDALADAMAQAVVWYYTNVIALRKN